MVDGLTTDDADVTTTCQIIITVRGYNDTGIGLLGTGQYLQILGSIVIG